MRQYLASAQAEDELLHGLQALQAELQTDVEEEEDDTQLRQVPHALHVPDDACGEARKRDIAAGLPPKSRALVMVQEKGAAPPDGQVKTRHGHIRRVPSCHDMLCCLVP